MARPHNDTITVGGDARETIEFYLLLTHSHDGSKKTSIAVLPLRVGSQTTLAWQLKTAARILNLTARESSTLDLNRIVQLAHDFQAELEQIAERAIHTPLSDTDFATFLNRLLPTPKQVLKEGRIFNQRGITMAENTKGTITTIYYNNPSIAHIRGTVWGAIQAAQYYSDHHTINRTTDDATPEENRFTRITSGSTLGNETFALALELANAT